MIIDGHGHACGEYLSAEHIKAELAKNQADMVVLTPGELNSARTYKFSEKKSRDLNRQNKLISLVIKLTRALEKIPEGNRYVYELKKQAPFQIKQYYWVTGKSWLDIDQDYNEMKFEGIKLHQCWERFKISSSWFEEVMAWAMAKELPLFIHLHDYEEAESLVKYIKAHPKAKIIIAHLYGLENFLEEDIRYFENIYFDLSNSYFIPEEKMMRAYRRFGSTKLLLGSDTPYGVDALKKTIEHINRLEINSKEKENILGMNLKELLKV